MVDSGRSHLRAANALRVAAQVTEPRELPKMDPLTQDRPARKGKVLFMPTSFSLAHVGRLVTLAQALSADNYEVTFACDQRDHRFIPAGFQRRHATSLTPEEFRRRLEQGRALVDAPLLRKQVQEDLDLMRSLQFDLVVGDFRPSLAISGKLAGVPYLNLVNAHWSPWSKEQFQVPAALDRAPFKWLGSRLARELINRFLPLGFAWQSRPFNQVRREYGLAPVGNSIRDVYTAGDFTVYPDLAEMVPTPGAPASHRHIGPVQWEPEIPLPGWWQELPQHQ
jgi:UDP:flavonoid glycosyltransferase YjiC (YdhE family)